MSRHVVADETRLRRTLRGICPTTSLHCRPEKSLHAEKSQNVSKNLKVSPEISKYLQKSTNVSGADGTSANASRIVAKNPKDGMSRTV